MSEEKPNTPQPVPINQDITADKPIAPANKLTTNAEIGSKPISPHNLYKTGSCKSKKTKKG